MNKPQSQNTVIESGLDQRNEDFYVHQVFSTGLTLTRTHRPHGLGWERKEKSPKVSQCLAIKTLLTNETMNDLKICIFFFTYMTQKLQYIQFTHQLCNWSSKLLKQWFENIVLNRNLTPLFPGTWLSQKQDFNNLEKRNYIFESRKRKTKVNQHSGLLVYSETLLFFHPYFTTEKMFVSTAFNTFSSFIA